MTISSVEEMGKICSGLFMAFLRSVKAHLPEFLTNKKTGGKIIECFASLSSNKDKLLR